MMRGLQPDEIDASQQPAPPPSPPEQQPAESPAPQDTEGAQPNLDEQYRRFVLNGCLMLYDKKVFQTVVSSLRRSNRTGYVAAVANIAVMIVRRLQKSAPTKLDPNVMMQGGAEIIEEIADISQHAKIHTFTDEEKKAALYKGIDMVRDQMDKAGEIDHKSAQSEWGDLQQADSDGALDDEKLGLKKEFANVDTGEPQRPGMPRGKAAPQAPPPKRRGLPSPGMSS